MSAARQTATLADIPLGRHPLGRHPLSKHPPRVDTPWQPLPCPVHAGIHPPAQCMLGYIPLPSACWDTHTPAQCMLGYGQQVGGTHPTGRHSCLKRRFIWPCTLNNIFITTRKRTFGQGNVFRGVCLSTGGL